MLRTPRGSVLIHIRPFLSKQPRPEPGHSTYPPRAVRRWMIRAGKVRRTGPTSGRRWLTAGRGCTRDASCRTGRNPARAVQSKRSSLHPPPRVGEWVFGWSYGLDSAREDSDSPPVHVRPVGAGSEIIRHLERPGGGLDSSRQKAGLCKGESWYVQGLPTSRKQCRFRVLTQMSTGICKESL